MKDKAYARRAVGCILQHIGDGTLKSELERLNIPKETFSWWSRGRFNPTAPALEAMALAGYDIHYILTGVRKDNED
jgi:hypothetical protein